MIQVVLELAGRLIGPTHFFKTGSVFLVVPQASLFFEGRTDYPKPGRELASGGLEFDVPPVRPADRTEPVRQGSLVDVGELLPAARSLSQSTVWERSEKGSPEI